MDYREFPPPARLAPFVAAIWTLRGLSAAPAFDLVLPDGRAELVIHRTGRFREWRAAGDVHEQPRAIVAGVMDRAVVLSPAPAFETIGVRLMPYGLARLCADPLDRAGEGIAPAEALLAPAVASLVAAVTHADGLADAVRILQDGLARAFDAAAPPPVAVVAAVREIRRTRGRVSIDRLVKESGAGARALERQFDRWVGLSPKRYARVVRFHHAVGALIAAPGLPGARLAVDHGYFDQAHLSRDFKAFTGAAPRAFISGRLGDLTRQFASLPVSDSSKTAPAGCDDPEPPGGTP
jgi:AraC-like DNA-binding protein